VRSRLSDLTESLLRVRGDLDYFGPASDDPEDGLEFFGGPHYFDDECIYDTVDDPTAQWLLNDWLDGTMNVGWSVHRELSKLLGKRGNLVRDRVEPIIRDLAALAPDEGGFTPWAKHQLCLSFLPSLPDAEALALRLLDRVPEDFRDGLLRACYSLNTPAIYEAMKASVRRWEQDIWCGSSTGELWLVQRMLDRWDRTFPGGDHADIRQFCQSPT
jgi:hypothetical protein